MESSRKILCIILALATAVFIGNLIYINSDSYILRRVELYRVSKDYDHSRALDELSRVSDDKAGDIKFDIAVEMATLSVGQPNEAEAILKAISVISQIESSTISETDMAWAVSRILSYAEDKECAVNRVEIYQQAIYGLRNCDDDMAETLRQYLALSLEIDIMCRRTYEDQVENIDRILSLSREIDTSKLPGAYALKVADVERRMVQIKADIENLEMFIENNNKAATVFEQADRMKNGETFTVSEVRALCDEMDEALEEINDFYKSDLAEHIESTRLYSLKDELETKERETADFLRQRMDEASSQGISETQYIAYQYAIGGGWEVYTGEDIYSDTLITGAKEAVLKRLCRDIFAGLEINQQ